jgi:hypothetical protein
MFKRIRWLGVGAVAGVTASVWTQRKARAVAARYRPAGVAGAAAGRAREWPDRLRAALVEGRVAMHERESELRSRLNPPSSPIDARSRLGLPIDPLDAGRHRLTDH